jgi:ABC-type enterochelin transport system ATPase subunit
MSMNVRSLYTGVKECEKCYQPASHLVESDNGDLLADSRNILNWEKNYFGRILNVHGSNNIRQTEICTVDLLLFAYIPLRN